MPTPVIRYPFDKTGTNPNNLVYDEQHTLTPNPKRVFTPKYGPYFLNSVVLIDNETNQLLSRTGDNPDWYPAVYNPEVSDLVEASVYELIVIRNQAVSNDISVTYQNVGGQYQNVAFGIQQLYEAFLADDRAVDWENILNKPAQFPPSPHQHFMSETINWGPVLVKLEQIANAITMTNIPAFEALIGWVRQRIYYATNQQIANAEAIDALITLKNIQYAATQLAFNSISIIPDAEVIGNRGEMHVEVTASNLDRSTPYYWTIEHGTTSNADFPTLSGVLTFYRNKASFMLQTATTSSAEAEETFQIGIRRGAANGPLLIKSVPIKIREYVVPDLAIMMPGLWANDPRFDLSAESLLVLN